MRENWRKSYMECFRYASFQDKFCTTFGLITAIFAGICDPVIIILFGFMAQEFIDYEVQTNDLTRESIGHKWLERRNRNVNQDSLFDTTVYLGILTISIGCAEWILGTTFISALNYSAQRQAFRIRIEYFRAILRHEITWLKAHKPQELSMDIIRHTNNIFEALGEKLGILVCTAVASLASFTVALSYGWLLSLILLAIVPVVFIIGSLAIKMSTKLKKYEECSYEASECLAADCIVNIRSVAAYQGQRIESKSYSDSLSQCEVVEQRLGCFWGFVSGILWFIMYCSYSLAFYYGMLWCTVDSGIFSYTPRDLITIFFSFQIGVMNLLQIPVYLKTIYKAEKSGDAIFTVIDKKFNIDSSSLSGKVFPNFGGSVAFNNIYFSYPLQLHTKVLQGVTFSIFPQQIVAFAGASGSGKTTCLNLLCRFYDPQFGTVQFDGVELPQLNLTWLRSKIGFVDEKNALFGATVGDAIRCGLTNISQNEIMDVAKIVDVHEAIMSLPKKYSAPIVSIVSDEIRKKLSIARALIRKPSVLILDNISMNLTADDESKILNSIIKHGIHKILIVVSTRLETLKMADKIIHLVNGVVVEEDSYAKLIENKQWFFNVIKRKFKLGVKEINGEDTIEEFEPVRKSRLDNLTDLNRLYYAKQNISKYGNMKVQNAPSKTFLLEFNPVIIVNCKKEKGIKCSLLRINMKEWLQLLIGCVAAALCGASLTVYAVLFGECLAVISRKTKQEFQPQLEFYTEMFLAAGVLSGIALFVQGYVISASGVKLTKRLRQKTFDAILRQEMSWFDNEENCLPNLLHMLKVDTANAQKVSGRYIVTIVQTSASLLASAILSFYYNWKLGMCTFFFFPFMLLSMIYRGYMLRGQILQDCSLLAKTKSVTDEALINAETVHAFCLEQMFLNQYATELRKVHMEVRNMFKIRGFLYGFALCIPTFACTTCMFLGSYLIKEKEIPYTNVFKVTEALILGSVLVAHLVLFSPNVVKAEESSSRVLSLIKRKPLICSFSNDSQSKWKTQGHIRFYKVFFNHPTYTGLPQLIKFSLQIQEGEVVALVGAASSGNSIPIHLLLRFYNPSEGSLLIDGRDICGINLWTIRRQIGLVDGDPIFFHRTIAENIGYGEQVKEAKRDDIIAAAKEANIHNYITTLSEGYDTVLDNNVIMTSSQKFRLSLARALLHDPPILLMDNLQQAENEDSKLLVESAVKHACLGRTCLLVSQYVQSPVQLANIICLLRGGSVIEEGPHKTLMEHKGLYYQLYCHQELQSHSLSSNL